MINTKTECEKCGHKFHIPSALIINNLETQLEKLTRCKGGDCGVKTEIGTWHCRGCKNKKLLEVGE